MEQEPINTNKWITQQALATELTQQTGVFISVQRIHNWVRRGKIPSKLVKELGATLVDKTNVPHNLL